MNELIIVDGYNFIFNFVPEQGMDNDRLAFYRDRLINDLAGYSEARGRGVVVVFDARHSNNSGRTTHAFDKIKVIYSKRGETADTVIEEMVNRDRTHSKIFVVTSDYLQQKVIFKKNIYRISSREFGLQLNQFKSELRREVKEINRKSESSFYNLGTRLSKKALDDFTKIRNN
ncbi:MAG: NYN domain-containing protein [Actinomycetia bacterium]|nr:NYN domain-containing protein [Actinomycetes bacterium]